MHALDVGADQDRIGFLPQLDGDSSTTARFISLPAVY
jgi:hypothetical protein